MILEPGSGVQRIIRRSLEACSATAWVAWKKILEWSFIKMGFSLWIHSSTPPCPLSAAARLYFGAKSLIHFDLHQRVTTGLCCGASGLPMLGSFGYAICASLLSRYLVSTVTTCGASCPSAVTWQTKFVHDCSCARCACIPPEAL